eukprot:TRINITY_DN17825_c0_g1_i1.p1 TRINITY_DN17825_c0_g1~~TRINITY_DN17825_c0_g1_i1.p1  ORF type:complete len:401 (+),score=54.35 TRINITY_DN17825_c0_g1_i1:151-1353(+)
MTFSQLIKAVQSQVYSLLEWLKLPHLRKLPKCSRRDQPESLEMQVSLASADEFDLFMKNLFGFPTFVNRVLYQRYLDNNSSITELYSLLDNKDPVRRLFNVMKSPSSATLSADDLTLFIEDFTLNHPGLAFLKDSPEVQSKYVETVCARILYNVNRSKTGKITFGEFSRSKLPQILLEVETKDINTIDDFFSYIEFFVILTKFQELDLNQDQLLSKDDLQKYSNYSLTHRVVQRIFGNMRLRSRITACSSDLMTYKEFIWFILSEEDKTSITSIEYWFQCLDVDGDGYLGFEDLEYFYDEQLMRMSSLGVDQISKNDIMEEIFQMIGPKDGMRMSLSEVKKSKLSKNLFNTLFNLSKFMSIEYISPNPFRNTHNNMQSDWKNFTSQEYEKIRKSLEEQSV